jgi:type II secretion system protein N
LTLAYNAAQQENPNPGHIEIGKVTWSWRFPGVVVKDVDLYGPKPAPAAEGEKTPQQHHARIEDAYVGVSLLSYLFGTTHLSFQVEGFGGELSGAIRIGKTEQQIKVELTNVDIGQLPGVAETLQLPLSGSTTGQIELRLPEGKYSAAEGNVDLSATDVKIGDGRTKIRGLLALPTVNAGTLTLKATTAQGRVKLEKFELKGPDLSAEADGRIRLRDKLGQGLVEQLGLSFKFSDKYRDKDDSTRALLGKAGDAMGGVIDFDPKVKQAKQPDGSYGWKVTGSFNALTFLPSPTPVGAAKK